MDRESQKHTSPEKDSQESPPFYSEPTATHDGKGGGVAEAADLYGDLATAESYGYVARGYDAILFWLISSIDGEFPGSNLAISNLLPWGEPLAPVSSWALDELSHRRGRCPSCWVTPSPVLQFSPWYVIGLLVDRG